MDVWTHITALKTYVFSVQDETERRRAQNMVKELENILIKQFAQNVPFDNIKVKEEPGSWEARWTDKEFSDEEVVITKVVLASDIQTIVIEDSGPDEDDDKVPVDEQIAIGRQRKSTAIIDSSKKHKEKDKEHKKKKKHKEEDKEHKKNKKHKEKDKEHKKKNKHKEDTSHSRSKRRKYEKDPKHSQKDQKHEWVEPQAKRPRESYYEDQGYLDSHDRPESDFNERVSGDVEKRSHKGYHWEKRGEYSGAASFPRAEERHLSPLLHTPHIKPEPPDKITLHTKPGGDLFLNVEKTNRLRAKFGLKPLEKADVNLLAVNISKVKKEVEIPPRTKTSRDLSLTMEKTNRLRAKFGLEKAGVGYSDVNLPAVNIPMVKKEVEIPPHTKTGEDLSLTMEKTNRLRAKFGLKPLEKAGAGYSDVNLLAVNIPTVKKEVEIPPHTKTGEDLSLTMEKNNRLRAKFGLKPLEKAVAGYSDVHLLAVNIPQVKKETELRENLLQARKKHTEKLTNVTTTCDVHKTAINNPVDMQITEREIKKEFNVQTMKVNNSSIAEPEVENLNHRTELYVCCLPDHITTDKMWSLFQTVGPVTRINVYGYPMCYGFVRYQSSNHAYCAIQKFNGLLCGSKRMRVTYAHLHIKDENNSGKETEIRIRNLASHVDSECLRVYLCMYGNVINCQVHFNNLTGISKRIGHVKFDTKEAAELAITMNHNKQLSVSNGFLQVFKL